jgi:histidinol phosphatase-like enzyme
MQDGTLVVPESGADFARSATDWRFINGKVKDVVQQFHKDGYKIVIFR